MTVLTDNDISLITIGLGDFVVFPFCNKEYDTILVVRKTQLKIIQQKIYCRGVYTSTYVKYKILISGY